MSVATRVRPSCAVCGSDRAERHATARDVEYFTTPETFTYWRCLACGVLFIDPVPRDQLARIYPPNYYAYTDTSRGLAWRVKAWLDGRNYRRVLRAVPGEVVDVLDIGGGTGAQIDVVRAVEPRFRRGHVVDLDPAGGAAAQAKGYGFTCARFEEMPGEESFQLVLMLNLVEHVEDPRAVLAAAARRLAPGGRLLVQTPNTASWDARLFRHDSWGGYHCPRHWVLFDRESFARLARECGLAVESIRLTQGAPFWAVSVVHACQRRSWVKLGPERPAFYHPLYKFFLMAFAAFDLLRGLLAPTSQMFVVLRRAE